jgi:hypothetical protein
MKFDVTIFALLSSAALTISLCPRHVLTLADKLYLQHQEHNQQLDGTESVSTS